MAFQTIHMPDRARPLVDRGLSGYLESRDRVRRRAHPAGGAWNSCEIGYRAQGHAMLGLFFDVASARAAI